MKHELTGLRELLPLVESGSAEWSAAQVKAAFGKHCQTTFLLAKRGDETAAFALMREVLGDRWLVRDMFQLERRNIWCVCLGMRDPASNQITVTHTSLPTAILLAVIKAKIFELENDDAEPTDKR